MNIYHSSQIFDELNAPFCTFFTVLCSNWRDYGKKYRSFSVGKWYECREYHPLFPGKRFACVALVLTNRQNAFVLERAKGLGVPCVWFAKSDWESGELVLSTLREHDIDFVVLAGFLARVPDNILHAYPNKMINIHPSLLPKFGGKGMYGDRVHEAVIASGEKESGITIHYTNEHYDEGGIICQQKCPVLPGDTPEELAQRIHRLEYEYYPKVIEELVEGLSPSYL
jgi:phosphoribosylglycinamide formyltransferase-1